MVRRSCTIAMLAAVSMKCVGAFIHSSVLSIHKHQTGCQKHLIPSLHYTPSSDENAREEEIFSSPYDDLFSAQKQKHEIKHVHIILFNQGLKEEGVHCIEYPKNSGSNTILAFESYKDCKRFATNLESQIDSGTAPQTQKIPRRNLSQYANELGIAVQVIPAGMNIKPPGRDFGYAESSEYEDQVSLLMKLKKQKTLLDRLIGASASSSSESAGDIDSLPTWG